MIKNKQPKIEKVVTHGYLKNIYLTNRELVNASESIDDNNKMIYLPSLTIDIIQDVLRIRNVSEADLKKTKFGPRGIVQYMPPEERVIIEWIHDDIHAITESYNLIDKVLLALRLIKSKPVFLTKTYNFINEQNAYSDKVTSLVVPHPEDVFYEPYYLVKDDEKLLKEIVEKLHHIDMRQDTPFRIACDRFGRSHYDLFYEDQLIDLCIGFEALFLKGERLKAGLGMGQVIGLACSMLLGANEEERKKISQTIVNGYNFRNNIVHGKKFNLSKIGKINTLLKEYLRQSIVKLLPA